jgi:hypothetical protein
VAGGERARDRGHRGRAGQVSDDRNDEVARLQRFHELERILRRQVIALAAGLVGGRSRLSRRTSTMKAIEGRTSAMYVKF